MPSMKSIRYHRYGGPEVLELETIERPRPGPGEVLIAVRAAGVNPVDWKIRSGMAKAMWPVDFPSTPGIDAAGIIEELGEGVSQWKKGQEVFGITRGSYAEFAIAKAEEIAAKPTNIGYTEAAAIPVGSLTALAEVERAEVSEGRHVLVLGAAGGVGLFAVQLAIARKAKVWGSCSAGNREFVASLGAIPVDYAKSAEFPRDLDAVLDNVGGPSLESAYGYLKKGGILVTVAGGPDEAKARELGLRAVSEGRGPASNLGRIARLVGEGRLRPEIEAVFPLAKAREAHERSESRHGRGRIVLEVP